MTASLSNIVFRNGRTDDRQQMQELGLLTYGQFADSLTSENWTTMSAIFHNDNLFAELINAAASFVCEQDNHIIGMAFLMPNGHSHPLFKSAWSHIRMVGVHPQYSGRGIGKELMKMCVDHAIQTKEKTIALHTSELMNAARHIYENMGFKKYREIDPIYGLRYWVYTLDLPQE